MNFTFLILLLILIDLRSRPLILLTAICHFSMFGVFHMNSLLFSGLLFIFKNFSFFFFVCVGSSFYVLNISFYVIQEIYFNLLIWTFIACIPLFFIYNYYYKILDNNHNIHMLEKIFTITIKFIIVIITYMESNVPCYLIFLSWIFCLFYKNGKQNPVCLLILKCKLVYFH